MAIEQKKNDWLATNFFSPDKSFEEFAALGITPDNSSLQNEDYYTKLPDIQEAFKTDSGDFDSAKFHKYYQEILKSYNTVEAENLNASLLDFYEYDPNNYFAPMDSKVADVAPRMVQFANPDRRSRGLVNLHEISAPTMSAREVAQQNRVFNVETGKFEDWTPNDWGGLKAITRPALVLAQWDEDGVHEVNGRQVAHKRGDLKYNELGDTYYETLGKRDLAGKDILHISDTLSVDGSKWNKYDFFDSDGIDKSVAGTIAKTVTKMIPMFIPYGVGTAYGAMTAAIELGKTFPVLYKALAGIASGDLSNSKSAQAANEMQAWFSKFDSSTSDKGKQGFFTLENLGTVIADSSKQLFQQRTLAKIPELLSKGNITDKTMKWGKGISLAYMAATSTTDSYDAFKEAGANDRVAGLGMLASGLAMYGLMQGNYFGITDHMFRGTYLDKQPVTKAIKNAAKDIVDNNINKNVASPKEAANWVLKSTKKLKDVFAKIDASEIMKDSLAEGTEEVIEEISGDAVKAFFKGLNAVGLIDKDQEYNFGFSVKDMASRYATAFGGGAIGGAVFHLQGKYENWFDTNIRNKKPLQMAQEDPDSFKALIYLFQQGKGVEARSELEKLHRKGKLGSTNLSGTDWEYVKDDKGVLTRKYKTAEAGSSQNDIVYQKLSDYFDWIENTITEEGLNVSEEEIQSYVLEQKDRAGKDISTDEAKKQILLYRSIQLANSGVCTTIFEDWNDLTAQILTTKAKLEEMLAPKAGESTEDKSFEARKEALKNNAEYKKLSDKLKNLRQQYQDLMAGKKSDFYFGQWMWVLQPGLSRTFAKTFGKTEFIKNKYGKTYDQLSDDEKASVDQEYLDYSKYTEKHDVLAGYGRFVNILEKLKLKFSEVAKKFKTDIGLYKGGHSVFTWQDGVIKSRIYEIENRVHELESLMESDPDNASKYKDEIDNLGIEKNQLEQQQRELAANPIASIQRQLSEEGESILQRPVWNISSEEFDTWVDSYLKMNDHIVKNGIYTDSVDPDLEAILKQYVKNNSYLPILREGIASRINKMIGIDGYLDSNSEDLSPIISSWAEISKALSNSDLDGAIQIYEQLVDTVKNQVQSLEEGTFSEGLKLHAEGVKMSEEDFIKQIFPKIGKKSFIDFLTEVKQTKAQFKKSPVYDIIQLLNELEGGPENLLNTLDEQILNYLRGDSTADYFIKDPKVTQRLERLEGLLRIARGINFAHVEGGFNYRVNSFREGLEKELFGVVDRATSVELDSELERMHRQVVTLLACARMNEARVLGGQKDIELNMRDKLFEDIHNPAGILGKAMSAKFDIDLEDILRQSGYDSASSPEEKLAAQVSFETILYQHVRRSAEKKGWTEQDIANKIVECFGDPMEIMKGKTTNLSAKSDIVVTDHDKFVHLTMLLAAPSQNFHAEFKKRIESATTLAPTYAQEYSTRLMWSKVKNPTLFNLTLQSLVSKIPESASKYLKTKAVLHSVHTYGGAGVGKSRGTARWTKDMFSDATIITCAPLQEQVDNLNSALGHSGTSYTQDQILRLIFGKKETDPVWNDGDIVPILKDDGSLASAELNKTLPIASTAFSSDGKPTILFIDEIGVFTRPALEAIDRWALKNNIIVFGLGDYTQNASTIDVKYKNEEGKEVTKTISSGVEDCYVFYGPELTAPFRPGNAAQLDNYNKLKSVLNQIYDLYWNNPEVSVNELGAKAEELLKAAPIIFDYFTTDGDFGGILFDTQRSVLDQINYLKGVLQTHPSTTNNEHKICVITDDPLKYQTIDGIVARRPDAVQGQEFDYVVIDSTLGKSGNYFDILKDLYTLSQRASKGVIVHGGTDIAKSRLNQMSNINIALDPNQIKNFIEWKKSLYSKVSDKTVAESKINTSQSEDTKLEDQQGDQGGSSDNNTPPTPQPQGDDDPKIKRKEFGERKKVTSSHVYVSGKSFYKWLHSNDNIAIKTFGKDIQSVTGTSISLQDKDWEKIHNIIRAYFVYGHYKDHSNSKDKLKELLSGFSSRTNWTSVISACENPSFEVIGDDNVLYAVLSNGLKIPLLRSKKLSHGKYSGDIVLTTTENDDYWEKDTKNKTRVKLSQIGGSSDHVFIFSLGDYKDSPSQILSESALKWYTGEGKGGRKKEGQSFGVICADPFVSPAEYKDFVTPIEKDGKYTYATNTLHDSAGHQMPNKFRLVGAFPRVVDETGLSLVWDRLGSTPNIIWPEQMGRIVVTVAKNNPDVLRRITKLIETNWTEGENFVRIEYTDAEGNRTSTDITSIDDLDALNYVHGVDSNLKLIKNFANMRAATIIPMRKDTDGKVRTQSSQYIAQGIFGKSFASKLKTYGSDIIGSEVFTEGLYLNSPLVTQTHSGVWYTSDRTVEYYTDITTIYGDSFVLNSDVHTQESSDSEKLKELNAEFEKFGKLFGIYVTLNDLSELNNAVEWFNSQVQEGVLSSPEYSILEVVDEKLQLIHVKDLDLLVANKLKISKSEINKIGEISSKYQIFSVSSHNNSSYYLVDMDKLGLDTYAPVPVSEKYLEVLRLKQNTSGLPSNISIYIDRILTGEKISEQLSKNFVQGMSYLNPEFMRCITEYLTEKIKKHEC